MAIIYANDTITVTGGSASDPYTMADLVRAVRPAVTSRQAVTAA